MNSYNENLHASVVSSLNEQEIELQKLKVQLDAATFSMYYAQGARITAAEKLELTTDKYKFQQQVNKQAVEDSDMSTNVLTSAKNVNNYISKSVSNTAVAASNVQIATNAILKLASDAGSIFSIVNAADFGTEIYQQAERAKELMGKTAYLAEQTSQHSMEASYYVAEVAAPALADKAKLADSSVKELLTTVATELENTTKELTTETANLSEANTEEKKTEGTLEDVNAAYNATLLAYNLSNNELNLGLKVKFLPIVENEKNKKEQPKRKGDQTNYTVEFNRFRSPFEAVVSKKIKKVESGTATVKRGEKTEIYNPVEGYFIMLVKMSKKDTFSIAEAEGIVTKGDESRYIELPQEEFLTKQENRQKITERIFTSELLDTDGEKMNLGEDYTIFIFAELRNNYKKVINNFDNYLSAASAKFALTNTLNDVAYNAIKIVTVEQEKPTVHEVTPKIGLKVTAPKAKKPVKVTQTLQFHVWENRDYTVGYRAMFLPHNPNLITGLLTVEGLASVESETEGLEEIADIYNPQIVTTNSEITSIKSEITGVDALITENKAELKANKTQQRKKGISKEELTQLQKQEAELTKTEVHLSDSKKKLNTNLKKLTTKLQQLESGKNEAIQKLEAKKEHQQPGFYFDLLTAEQVPAGSYITTIKNENSTLEKLSKDILNVIETNEDLEVNHEKLALDITVLKKDLQKLIQDVSKKDLKQIKVDITKFLNDIKGVIADLKAISKALGNIIDEIIQFVIDAVHASSLEELLDDIKILFDGYKYLFKGYICTKQSRVLDPETTDNFGNRLIDKNEYIPVILSISDAASVEENQQYTNALSDFQHTNSFLYNTIQKNTDTKN